MWEDADLKSNRVDENDDSGGIETCGRLTLDTRLGKRERGSVLADLMWCEEKVTVHSI